MTTSAITGILVGSILGILGLDLAFVFGVLAFFLNFIPNVGSIIAVLLPLPLAIVPPGAFAREQLTLNDATEEIEQLSDWVLENLGDETPLHFTAFHPDFKLRDKPRTPPETVHAARRIARERGLKYVYEGNIHSDGGHTLCPGCGREVIRRSWHRVLEYQVGEDGTCAYCGYKIKGYFASPSPPQNNKPGVFRSGKDSQNNFSAV